MKKNIAFFLITLTGFLAISGCAKQYLTGYYTPKSFAGVCNWKTRVAEKYNPKEEYMAEISTIKDSVDVRIYLGTYCPDSKKWVPRFFKLLPLLPVKAVEIISVDTTKIDVRGLAMADKIEKIPTFVLLRGGSEIGRIVEKPKMRLEKRISLEFKKE